MLNHYNNDPLFRILQLEGGGCCEGGGSVPLPPDTGNDCMAGRSLAMVYSPCQQFQGLYEPGKALLQAGTLFAELEKPFYGARRLK